MTTAVGFVLLGGLLLFVGGEALVRGATAIALRSGLSPMVVGLTVVAFGTSCPELAVSLGAAIDGHGDVALGNVIGSNIANIALVAGLAAIIAPMDTDRDLIRIDAPVLVVLTLGVATLIYLGQVERWVGICLLLVLCFYTIWRVRVARKNGRSDEEVESSDKKPVALMAALTVGGIVILVIGGSLFVDGALVIAKSIGVSEAVISLTLLAIGTSLPEIATTVVASLRGNSDLALGNAIGSCIYNILAVLGATAAFSPILVQGITAIDAVVLVVTTLAIWLLIFTGRKFTRAEGFMLLCGYCAYFAWLFIQ